MSVSTPGESLGLWGPGLVWGQHGPPSGVTAGAAAGWAPRLVADLHIVLCTGLRGGRNAGS